MSFTALTATVESLFTTGWASSTPICYDNIEFTAPDNNYWVALSVMEGPSSRASLGSPAIRRTRGTVALTLHCPVGTGTQAGKTKLGTAAGLFRDVQVSGVTFLEPSMKRGGTSPDTQMYKLLLSVPFFYDEIL